MITKSSTSAHRVVRHRFRTSAVAVTALLLALTGMTTLAGSAANALARPHVAAALCNAKVTAGSGTVVGTFIVGATAGLTVVTLDCDTASGAAIAAEASLLAGVGSASVMLANEADVSALGTFTANATDTGCPGGVAGTCTIAAFTVPATFAAGDANATCPPTAAESNVGLFGCAVAVATAAEQPVAEYLMTYASQTASPNAPTIAATVATGPPSSTITVSDAAANSGYWWANAIQQSQAVATGTSPATQPASCTSGGYGNVPAAFLAVNWVPSGGAAPIAGSAAGVTISNTCYDSKTLFAPVLSGTIPVPSTVVLGTSYTVYLCELNITAFPGNDAGAAAHCGPAPTGLSWIDASFAFTATAGTPQAALSVTSVSGSLGTPLTLTTSGGSGTGAVSFSIVDGTASGCAVTAGALSATSGGTCVVTASKASDSTFLGVSSTPTTVTLTAPPVVKLASTRVTLKKTAKTLTFKISCTNAPCSGSLDVSARIAVKKPGSKKTIIQTLDFGTLAFHVSRQQVASVTLHLSKASQRYLVANPHRPTIQASVYITDNLGKKHSYIGRVSLLK
jgi:hypothetical protein